jgi:hypothetical protein
MEVVYFHPEHQNIIFHHCGCILSQLIDGLLLGNNDGMRRKGMMQNDHLKVQEVEGRGML